MVEIRTGIPVHYLPPGPLRELFLQHYGFLKPVILPYFFTSEDENFHRRWREHLTEVVFPRSSIPRGLKLVKGTSLQPPRFVYGWAVDPISIHKIMLRLGFPPEETHTFPNYLCPHIFSSVGTLFLTEILEERLPLLVEEMGGALLDDITIPTQPGKLPNGGLGNDRSQCISIADSYVTGNKIPRPEYIETLRQLFGIGEGEGELAPRLGVTPKWYVDRVHHDWEVFNSREYKKGNDHRRAYRKYRNS
ncbi:hypothetical protein BKA70DRAFT_825815 [Coprinopsis sp. MPI-PUGE-AT-0042]|nr:hypothetical protein BKA70DRAFT_825815 [Coprinopsis sp. MPI-PUGE-AT-0042]